jgi:hypothetical protein
MMPPEAARILTRYLDETARLAASLWACTFRAKAADRRAQATTCTSASALGAADPWQLAEPIAEKRCGNPNTRWSSP